MSTLLLSVFLLWNNGAGGTPILFVRDEPDIPFRRSMAAIIWGCLSTIFLCAWTSIHPNVPPPKEGRSDALKRRLTLMFWAIIAPELILAWAVRQWYAAREVARAYNEGYEPKESVDTQEAQDEKWTRAHGHLVIMGGIMLIYHTENPTENPGQPLQTERRLLGFDLALVKRLAEDNELLDITEDDINDKSTRDSLAKALAILQTTWFIVQCITRGVQKIALTELELVTLALASLNGITFAFWWNKPLDVKVPIRVRLKQKLPPLPEGGRVKKNRTEAAHAFSIAKKAGDGIRGRIFDIIGSSCNNPLKVLILWFILLPIYLLLLLLLPIFTLVLLIYAYLFDIVDTHHVPSGALHVPMFYAPETASDGYSRMLVFALFGVLFGGLHCIAWNFNFPTDAERHLWRVTSLMITGIPFIVAPIDFIITNRGLIDREARGFERFVRGVLIFLLVSLLFIYVPARLSLLLQALALLREQPPSAFYVVEWTKFIPHIR